MIATITISVARSNENEEKKDIILYVKEAILQFIDDFTLTIYIIVTPERR
ncbi:hypothetical protein [Clostridium sp.]